MNKGLRMAVKKAEEKLNEASIAVQNIERHLTFAKFRGELEPQVTWCNGDEIIIEYYGGEIPIEIAIEIMEDRGYITPDDFS